MNTPSSIKLIWYAVIAAIAPTLSSVAALIVAVRTTNKIETVQTKVEAVQKNTDGMKDALVAAAKKEGKVEGKVEGKKEGVKQGIATEKARPFWKK